jgi:hypothetical protein
MLRFRTSLWTALGIVMAISFVAATPSQAQVRPGVQAGMSLDPDQFFFGGHVETSPLVDRLRFRPGVDIGIGDDVTLVGFNLDFTYTFASRSPWAIYAGGGPALNWIDDDFGSDTAGGFNLLIGARQRQGMFFEMKIGMVDSPDFKFGVGYSFR